MVRSISSQIRGDDIDDQVFGEMLDLMYASARAIGFSIAMLMIAAIACSYRTGDGPLMVLTVVAGFVGALRLAISLAFLSRPRRGESRARHRLWQRRYAIGAFLYSSAFGALMFRAAMIEDARTFIWFYGLGCGYAAGLVGYVAMRPSIARIQSFILIVFGVSGCLYTGDPTYQMMAVTLGLGWMAILLNIQVQYRGVREMLESRRELDRISRTDLLTGLWNRRHFEERFAPLVAQAGGEAMLLAIDLDHFKPINDTHGHETGDEVLREVSRRFAEVAPPGHLMARTGGDEFSMLLTGSVAGEALAVADAVVLVLSKPIVIARGSVNIGGCVGLARVEEGDSYESAARRADIALYGAKIAGRNAVRVFDQPMASSRVA